MLPTFIGIGAPKCGTTWLFKCLAGHQDIYMAPIKETNFFDYADDISHRLQEYERHFAAADGHRAVGEISVRYLDSKWGAPERIRRWIPNVKLLLTIRNPVDQIYSHYWHLRRQNFQQDDLDKIPKTFEDALEEYSDKLVTPARYAQHIDRWLSYFNRDQLLIILYDDIERNPEVVIRKVFTFLDVDENVRPDALRERGRSVRKGTSPRSESLEPVRRQLYRSLNLMLYHPLKRLVGVRRAVQLKEKVRVREGLELVFMRQGYPPMSASTRENVLGLVAADVARLATILGRDLSYWR